MLHINLYNISKQPLKKESYLKEITQLSKPTQMLIGHDLSQTRNPLQASHLLAR